MECAPERLELLQHETLNALHMMFGAAMFWSRGPARTALCADYRHSDE